MAGLPGECVRSQDPPQTPRSLCLQVAQLTPTIPHHHRPEYLCVGSVWGVGG